MIPSGVWARKKGEGCPSAAEVWACHVEKLYDVLDLLEQCINLPGNVAQIVLSQLQQTYAASDHRSYTVNQLQYLLWVGGRAASSGVGPGVAAASPC